VVRPTTLKGWGGRPSTPNWKISAIPARAAVAYGVGGRCGLGNTVASGVRRGPLAGDAYRRPATNEDVESLMEFYGDGRKGRDFEAGIKAALQALHSALVKPPAVAA